MRIIACMAFDSNGIKFLLYARKMGVDFSSTATIGRQFNFANPLEIKDLFDRMGVVDVAVEKIEDLLQKNKSYSEGIFELLGAETVHSFDASDFEGATHIHDFNHGIPKEFENRYSVILDGGTLEHIFNYPIALKNCMEMVSEGGHFLSLTPTNNFPGHGFYQFSPELFFRVFTAQNGYELIDAVFMEDYPDAPWYRITDPAALGQRVTFESMRPSYVLLIARRTSIMPVFAEYPQQSDYSAAWESGQGGPAAAEKKPNLVFRIPGAVSRRLRRLIAPRALRFDPRNLSRFDPVDTPTSSKRTP